MKIFAIVLLSVSMNAFAQGPTTAVPASTGGTQTSATSVKDAKDACKKEGKEGKALVLCIKEKTK